MSNQAIYKEVTARIVAMLEAGVRPWAQGWQAQGGGRPLRHDGTPYRGMNVLNLWAAGMQRGFSSARWMTYQQAQALGAQVKKGAKSEAAFFVGAIKRTVESNGQEVEASIPFLKTYRVFNCDEIEGLSAEYYARPVVVRIDDGQRLAAVDTWIAGTGANISHGGGRAFYAPSSDTIRLPEFSSFVSAEAYYGTAAHELVHWSGAAKRLDRIKGSIFGSPDYAFEELVAELGAAYLCADLAITSEPREDHASYIASWLKALRDDPRNLFRAAAYAEKAAGYLHGLQEGASLAAAA